MKLPKPVRVLMELLWVALFTTTIFRMVSQSSPLSFWEYGCIAVMAIAAVLSVLNAVKHLKGCA